MSVHPPSIHPSTTENISISLRPGLGLRSPQYRPTQKKKIKKSTLTQRFLVDCCRFKDTSTGFFSRIYENNSYEPSDFNFNFSNLHNHPRAFCFPSLQKLPGFELPVVVNNLSFHDLSICPLPPSLPKDADGALRGV